jgi:type VI secretion system secreted protein Hcp
MFNSGERAMGLNAFLKIDEAGGESRQIGFEKQIEIQGWDWEVESESSWTKGGGASVGKPNPGKFNFEHYYDLSSNKIMTCICKGVSFTKLTLSMCKGTGATTLQTFFQMTMIDAFITKVANSASEDGNVVQKVELVFKEVEFSYRPQGLDQAGNKLAKPGDLGPAVLFKWSIPEGKAG